jgi:glucose-6-phosphate 1-dehydrogenase
MTASRSDALVFFGATGDLAYKQIFPALQALVRRGRFGMPIVGVARAGWNTERLKTRAQESLKEHGDFSPPAFEKLCSQLQYIDGDYGNPATFAELRKALGDARRPLHYLAIPPGLFATVAEGLATSGCVENARVVVEKPFGRDLASAQQLNRTLHRFFPERAIFRIDHYLGKEPVQNLIYFRFANPLIESGWDNRQIASVQVTMAERFGIAGRGKLYDELGAIRDVVQNHMLMVIACLTMECPAANHHESWRDERGQLLKSVRTLDPSDVVRGQYSGYRSEPGVASDSQIETFAAIRFHVDNERWDGVPFCVRVGKRLPVTATEVLVRFKGPLRPVLDETGQALPGHCRFRLGPETVLALDLKVKTPGERMVGSAVELVARRQPPDEMEPYERLLGDAVNGDPTLFAREDSTEESWRVVGPALGNAIPLVEYAPDSWGPHEAERILASEGGWHNPERTEAHA